MKDEDSASEEHSSWSGAKKVPSGGTLSLPPKIYSKMGTEEFSMQLGPSDKLKFVNGRTICHREDKF